MKKFSHKGVLLFAGAIAVCAVILPAAASAATWSVVGSEHSLDSARIGFTSPSSGGIVSNCSVAQFTTTVTNASSLTITTGFFRACTASGPAIGDCTQTWVPTGYPWHIDPVNLTTVAVTGLRIDVRFEIVPGSPTGSCPAEGVTTLLTGNFHGDWDQAHQVNLTDSEGVVAHSGGVATRVTIRGLFRDTQQTLVIS